MPGPEQAFFEWAAGSWSAGQLLLENGDPNGAANRFYYAAFQAVRGYFVKRQKVAINEADGIHGKLKKLLHSNWKDTFEDPGELRVTADYLPDPVQEADLKALLEDARKLLDYF